VACTTLQWSVKSSELFWRARLELVAEVTTTFKAVIQKTDYNKLEEAAKKRGKKGYGLTASALGFMTGRCCQEGDKGRAKCFLLCPLWMPCIPFFFVYIKVIAPALKRFASALAKNATSEIELKLNRPGASSDEWGGRVQDIIRRINVHSSSEAEKQRARMASGVKGEVSELKAEMNREMKELKAEMKAEMNGLKQLIMEQMGKKRLSRGERGLERVDIYK